MKERLLNFTTPPLQKNGYSKYIIICTILLKTLANWSTVVVLIAPIDDKEMEDTILWLDLHVFRIY